MSIQANEQNIDGIFAGKMYYIDFYQRQYKWNAEPVNRLLDDVFYTFKDGYDKNKDSESPVQDIIDQYPWYYLNTYVTNCVGTKTYVVDGQQRLTTITLILLGLRRLTMRTGFENLTEKIDKLIVERHSDGVEFRMSHEAHKDTMLELLEFSDSPGKPPSDIKKGNGLTSENMVGNFSEIFKRLQKELSSEPRRFVSFVYFFIHRLVMVELKVEQANTAMVFEVINDRGVKLRPHEILKGKLLGQVSKKELDILGLNNLWDTQVSKVNEAVTPSENDEIDDFFSYYLKAKYVNSSKNGGKYEKNYHRAMFSEDKLNLDHNPKGVIDFLQNEFKYYTDLYVKILESWLDGSASNKFPYVYFNHLTEMEMLFLLILSSCDLNDQQEDEKTKNIAFCLDRLYCLLQLQGCYFSYTFTAPIYKLSSQIRNEDVSVIKGEFDKTLRDVLAEETGSEIKSPLDKRRFDKKAVLRNDNKKFIRYFLARVEKFIADNTDMELKHSMDKLVNGSSFHIEHILADNAANRKLFDNDEELFETERNKLGGLLLLKGKDNSSSNNESFKDKLRTYANTLYWNETLLADSYKSKCDFTKMMEKYDLPFRQMNKFGKEELNERHKLLFAMVKLIWNA